MKRYTILLISILAFGTLKLTAQVGSQHIYDFIKLAPSARLNAIGGTNVSLMDDDVALASLNPALANDSMHHVVGLNYNMYLADVGYGYTGFAHTVKDVATFHAGIHFVNYGSMIEADPFGNQLGEFNAQEVMIVLGGSRAWKDFRYGANLKLIQSNLAPGFSSLGVALDLGTSYRSPNRLFTAGLALQNIGTQLTKYSDKGEKEPLPFEVVGGLSYKFEHMPLRLSVTATQLEQPKLIYDDVNSDTESTSNGGQGTEVGTVDKVFRHIVIGGELLLGKHLRLRTGYNHLRRQELRPTERAGMTGFSLGLGLRFRRLIFDYGFANYGSVSALRSHELGLRVRLGKQ